MIDGKQYWFSDDADMFWNKKGPIGIFQHITYLDKNKEKTWIIINIKNIRDIKPISEREYKKIFIKNK